MGQFKPMVKMETTEPSAILKLKKGGKVEKNCEPKHKKMAIGGTAMDAINKSTQGTSLPPSPPRYAPPTKSPSKPSMMDRIKSMTYPKGTTTGLTKTKALHKRLPIIDSPIDPRLKEGGKADKAQDKTMVKKAFKQHDSQQHKAGTKLSLKKGGKTCATGGVAMSNAGGYKKGGMMGGGGMHMMPDGKMMKDSAMKKGGKTCATGGVAMSNAGGYKDGGMTMVNKNGKMVPDFAADGKGKMKKGGKAMMDGGMANKKMMMGGYATGGVAMSNAGGYKHGGKTSKKAFAMGGTVNTGKPVAMLEGNKSVPAPMSVKNFSGTYKKGGEVEKMALGGRTRGRTFGRTPSRFLGMAQAMGQPMERPTVRDEPAPSAGAAEYDTFVRQQKAIHQAMPQGGMPPQEVVTVPPITPIPKIGANPDITGGKYTFNDGGTGAPPFGRKDKGTGPPSYTTPGGNPPVRKKMAVGGRISQRPAQTIRSAPAGSGSQATRDLFASKGKRPSYKNGGGVENQRLLKMNDAQNAPAVRASKADTNLKYPKTMNSPQKTPKLK